MDAVCTVTFGDRSIFNYRSVTDGQLSISVRRTLSTVCNVSKCSKCTAQCRAVLSEVSDSAICAPLLSRNSTASV